jgi:hypothetical protein
MRAPAILPGCLPEKLRLIDAFPQGVAKRPIRVDIAAEIV